MPLVTVASKRSTLAVTHAQICYICHSMRMVLTHNGWSCFGAHYLAKKARVAAWSDGLMAEAASSVAAASVAGSSGDGAGMSDVLGLPLQERPTCIICLGMAGSGKTTFIQVN